MAEGERAESGVGSGPGRPPQEGEPGALEQAEALKTQANEYFKGSTRLRRGGAGGVRGAGRGFLRAPVGGGGASPGKSQGEGEGQ